MPIIDAYRERKTEGVMHETWGHLAPKRGTTYSGWILIACGVYNGDEIIVLDDDMGLPDSPWWYEHLHDFVNDKLARRTKPGCVYRWTGTYTLFKNGRCRFSGKLKKLKLS